MLKSILLALSKFDFANTVSFLDGANESQRKDLQSELNVMKELAPHKHVVELLACITKSGMKLLEWRPSFGSYIIVAVWQPNQNHRGLDLKIFVRRKIPTLCPYGTRCYRV